MHRSFQRLSVLAASLTCYVSLCLASSQTQATAAAKPLRIPADTPALLAAKASQATILAVAHAGGRIVAVGDHGVVLLADDGRNFHQAAAVPVSSTLTDVKFVDDQHGWAVGHDGVVLASEDGGEHWQLLRRDDEQRTPLLGVWFENRQHGFAVGQFGTALETQDGGKSWTAISPADPDSEAAQQHYNAITGTANGALTIVGERGLVLTSQDHGQGWQTGSTGHNGSLLSVLALQSGELIATGIHGHLYRGTDLGHQWTRIDAGLTEVLTAATQLADGTVVVVGFGGVLLRSNDQGQSYSGTTRDDRLPLTAVIDGPSGPVLFSLAGVVPPVP